MILIMIVTSMPGIRDHCTLIDDGYVCGLLCGSCVSWKPNLKKSVVSAQVPSVHARS